MKKSIAILFVLLLIAGAAYARMTVVGIAGMVAAPAGSCSATAFLSQTTYNGQQSHSGISNLGQELKASDISGKTICRVDVRVQTMNSAPYVFKARFFQGGSQVGGDSAETSASDANTVYSITWSSDMPELSNADAVVYLIRVSGDGRLNYQNEAGGTAYQGTDYHYIADSNYENIDLYFVLYEYE